MALDGLAVRRERAAAVLVVRREAAAEVEDPGLQAARAHQVEDVGRGGDRVGPTRPGRAAGSRRGRRRPAASSPRLVGEGEHLDGLVGGAAVLARERPVRPLAGGDQAAEHLAAGCALGDLLDLVQGVHDEQPHPEACGLDDVVAPLDRVGVDEVRRVAAPAVSAARTSAGLATSKRQPRAASSASSRGSRVGLDGVVHRGAGQRPGQLHEAVAGACARRARGRASRVGRPLAGPAGGERARASRRPCAGGAGACWSSGLLASLAGQECGRLGDTGA